MSEEDQLDAQAAADLHTLVNSTADESTEDDLDTLSEKDLRKALAKARKEAASRRVANRELEDKAKAWEEHQKSQMSETEKLRQALAEQIEENKTLNGRAVRDRVALKYGISAEEVDLFFGDTTDEERLEKIAQALKENKGKGGTTQTAGQRGSSVSATQEKAPSNFNEYLIAAWHAADKSIGKR